jgi:hypothetical protein
VAQAAASFRHQQQLGPTTAPTEQAATERRCPPALGPRAKKRSTSCLSSSFLRMFSYTRARARALAAAGFCAAASPAGAPWAPLSLSLSPSLLLLLGLAFWALPPSGVSALVAAPRACCRCLSWARSSRSWMYLGAFAPKKALQQAGSV